MSAGHVCVSVGVHAMDGGDGGGGSALCCGRVH